MLERAGTGLTHKAAAAAVMARPDLRATVPRRTFRCTFFVFNTGALRVASF